MDRDLIETKLESLRRCIERIADTEARPPATMAENFVLLKDLSIITPALAERMTKAVGFRNIAVHTYQSTNWNIVYQICRHHLDDFRQFAKAVAQKVTGPE
jgi:uncharacterized protein YutE (UPF0331/DUF86 family)